MRGVVEKRNFMTNSKLVRKSISMRLMTVFNNVDKVERPLCKSKKGVLVKAIALKINHNSI